MLSRVLADQDGDLARRWIDLQLNGSGRTADQDGEEVRREVMAVLDALRSGIASELPVAGLVDDHPPLHDAIVQLSMRRARAGTAPTATAMAVLSLKEAMLEALARHDGDPSMRFPAAVMTNQLLDAAGTLSFQSYVEGREHIIRAQHQQMLELSTPVVRLWRRVLAVPLIGTLDSTRTQVVMNGLLEAIQAQEAKVAIIDITGVPTVDTVVAHHLLQTVSAVRLMGADCLISGIRPAIAQTITQLGIDLSTIVTRATLADALAEAIELTGAAR
nr:STAS domain-containing protein [Kibdelosporangium phytohabitans]